MQIQFQNIIPAPLEGVYDSESQIWNQTFTLQPSQRYQIYAPSGKGKSTFIHIIYGLRFDYQGELSLEKGVARNFKTAQWAKLRQETFAVVFQDLRLFLHLTAWENILANAFLYGKPDENEIKRMAEFLGISHRLQQKASTLSYGERQRTAIIRALVQPFQWLLLDEPFSHLDEQNIQKASELIEEKCQNQNAGILMTSLGYDYALGFNQKMRL